MKYKKRGIELLKKGIVTSGVVMRSLVGIGAAFLLFFGLKKRKKRT